MMNLRLVTFILVLIWTCALQISAQKIPLMPDGLDLINVTAKETVYRKEKAIRIVGSADGEQIAIVKNLEFKDGLIEIDMAGAPLPGSDPSFRGFIGLAFRVQKKDTIQYECFYIRPTNGRAEDQLRRNHSAQYIAHPGYPWFKLRKENPGVYESYVDLVAGEWTKVKIQVKGKDARLYVNDATQPCLIVTDMKNEVEGGGIALWIGVGTDGYFRNLKVSKE
jgi:hypothetical protein